MYEKTINYLMRREEGKKHREMQRDYARGNDYNYNNSYASRSGYLDNRGGRDYAMDRRDYASEYRGGMDRRYDSRQGYDSRYYSPYEQHSKHSRPMEYEMRDIGEINARPYYDHRSSEENERERDSRMGDYRDYRDYGSQDYHYQSEDLEKKYKEDLHKWEEKLKAKDKFRVPKQQIIQQAKSMGVKFDKYSEDEFYITYLMLISDFSKSLPSDYNLYIKMAKDFLEDDDVMAKDSEKLCKYYYSIVMGE